MENNGEKNKFLIINGPNLSMLQYREKFYGGYNLNEIENKIKERFELKIEHITSSTISNNNINNKKKRPEILFYTTNIEGEILNKTYEHIEQTFGLIINPGALTHYSYSILDLYNTLRNNRIYIIEVHITNPLIRGRNNLLTTTAADSCIMGFGIDSYFLALDYLLEMYYK
ncbi:MAG: type II 3-dehydroquinate dehydratase [Spirochaetes bacterium]|nr:type II 3-dehydroquinate dehydratase [Spirochaetota bacterium]